MPFIVPSLTSVSVVRVKAFFFSCSQKSVKGTLMYFNSALFEAFLASLSALSLPLMPMCPGIQ